MPNAAGDGGDGGVFCDFGTLYLAFYFLPSGKGEHGNTWWGDGGEHSSIALHGSFDIGPHVIVFHSEGGLHDVSPPWQPPVFPTPGATHDDPGPETLSFPYVYDAAHDSLRVQVQACGAPYTFTHTPLDPGAAGAGGSGD
jgi:hypothetical protein